MAATEEGWTLASTLTEEQADKLKAFRARLFGQAKSDKTSEGSLKEQEKAEGTHTKNTADGDAEGEKKTPRGSKGKKKEKKNKKKDHASPHHDSENQDGSDEDAAGSSGSELTEQQRQWCDDMCLCRYLRARDWDMDKAEEMIRATLAWRAEYKPELITAEDIESEAEQGKMYFNGQHDKFGRPIIYMKPVRDTSSDRVIKLKYLVWILEQAIAAMDASKGVEKMVWIADFKGTGMRTSSVGNMQVSMDCMHVLLNHYPERLGVAFMTNTPWVFSAFWSVIKPFLNEVTLSKVRFINGKKDFDKILEVIDEDLLEKDYGGQIVFEYDHEVWKAKHFRKSQDLSHSEKNSSGERKDKKSKKSKKNKKKKNKHGEPKGEEEQQADEEDDAKGEQ